MRKSLHILIPFVLIILLAGEAYAQGAVLYTRQAEEDPTDADCPVNPGVDEYRPLHCMVGEHFVFLPKPASAQRAGYTGFSTSPTGRGPLPYAPYAGKVITLEDIDSSSMASYTVRFRLQNGRRVYANVVQLPQMGFFIEGIGPYADIRNAQRMWQGRTLYLAARTIFRLNGTSISSDRFKAVRVTKVGPGSDHDAPVRFYITGANSGYVDVNLSGINTSEHKRNANRFEDVFLTDNPRTNKAWTPEIWNAINKKKVVTGMTQQQVKLSWGQPMQINKTDPFANPPKEHWIYGQFSWYLYFEGDRLVRIVESK